MVKEKEKKEETKVIKEIKKEVIEKPKSWIVIDFNNVTAGSFDSQDEAIELHKRLPNSRLMYRF